MTELRLFSFESLDFKGFQTIFKLESTDSLSFYKKS